MQTSLKNEERKIEEENDKHEEGSKIKKKLYFLLGSIFLCLGLIGIVLPVLPTTPFLLLTAACYMRSSERAYNWLMTNRIFGSYLKNYREGNGMPIKIKVITISFLWVVLLISAFIFVQILWIRVILFIVGISVSTHIILIRPKNKKGKEK